MKNLLYELVSTHTHNELNFTCRTLVRRNDQLKVYILDVYVVQTSRRSVRACFIQSKISQESFVHVSNVVGSSRISDDKLK